MKGDSKQDDEHFPESIGRSSESPVGVLGREVKEVDPSCHPKALMDKLGLPREGRLSSASGLRVAALGLRLMLLGLIFLNSYQAPGRRPGGGG